MRECSIVVCHAKPTWHGYLSTKDGSQGQVVRYCDEHAHTQVNNVPRNLRLTLNPIPSNGCTCPPGSYGRVMEMHKHDCPARSKEA